MKQGKLIIWFLMCSMVGILSFGHYSYSQVTDSLPTSPPVSQGSGARALGMGGAFIAVADDATAASWNPGGLGQLQKPEMSVVGSYFSRSEKYNEAVTEKGSCEMSSLDLNYLSVAYAKNLWQRNVFFSLNYQKLFDFSREVKFDYTENGYLNKIDFQQEGSLYTFSPAMAVEFKPGLYAGFVYNNWSDHVTGQNQWESKLTSITLESGNHSGKYEVIYEDDFQNFQGENWTFGFLWKVTPNFKVGGVFKTPFRARVKYNYHIYQYDTLSTINDPNDRETHDYGEKAYQIDFPAAYGLGFSYQIGDSWTFSGDITRTEWQDYIIYDPNRQEMGPFARLNGEIPKKDPTYTVRLGMEYAKILSKIVLPFRVGMFYDPEPSVGAPQDFYGMSVGCGIVTKRLSLDFAYNYRFGNEVNAHELGISPREGVLIRGKVRQHFLLSSLIFHF